MEKKTILLVEDDFLNRRQSKKILIENGYHILEAKNAKEAFEILDREAVTLAVLDIHLGEREQDGISIGQELQKRYALPFVYLTAYETADIISKAVASTPRAFLTKPFKDVDLLASVELAIRQVAVKPEKTSVRVKEGEFNVDLFLDQVVYIEAKGNYLLFHTAAKTYKKRSTIREMMEILPSSAFIQTHRAYIVNRSKVEKFSNKTLVVNNKVLPVSKKYIDGQQLFREH